MYVSGARCRFVAAALSLIFGLATELSAQSRAPEAVHLSLDQLLDTVRTVNPALKAARLDWVAQLQTADEPGLPDPSVMFTYLPAPVYTARGSQRWQISAEQRFPFPGKIRLQKEVAIENAFITQQRAAELDLQLGFELKRAFRRLQRIDRQVELARSFVVRLRAFEDAAASRYRVGAGSQQAIVKAQLERNSLDSHLLALDKARSQTEAVISRLLGRGQVFEIETVQEELRAVPSDLQVNQLVSAALNQRPDIRAIDAGLRRAEHQEDLARKQLYPDLGLSITYIGINQESIPVAADGQDALAIGATVRVPLYRSNKNASINRAQIAQSAIELRRENAEIALRSEVEDVLRRIELERERLKLIRETLVPQARSTLRLALTGYTNGKLEFIDLLDAERSLFAISNNLEETAEDYLVSIAQLELTLGIPSLDALANLGLLSPENRREQ